MSGQDTCKKVFNWIIQVLTWITIIYLIHNTLNDHLSLLNIILTIIVFGTYLINSFFFSSTYSFLEHVMKSNNLNNLFLKMVKTPIIKKFTIQNWHYEDDTLKFITSGGKKSKPKEIITSTDFEEFRVMSWRDTSGTFKLAEDLKSYLKLNLTNEMVFDDDRSKEEYEQQKEAIKEKNKGKDVYLRLVEETVFEGFEPFIMVRLSKEENPFINSTFYFIFTAVFPIVELYKLYVELQCTHQEFIFKKTVSTHKNINMPEYENKFLDHKPSISINGNIQFISVDETADGEKIILEMSENPTLYVRNTGTKGENVEMTLNVDADKEYKQPLMDKE